MGKQKPAKATPKNAVARAAPAKSAAEPPAAKRAKSAPKAPAAQKRGAKSGSKRPPSSDEDDDELDEEEADDGEVQFRGRKGAAAAARGGDAETDDESTQGGSDDGEKALMRGLLSDDEDSDAGAGDDDDDDEFGVGPARGDGKSKAALLDSDEDSEGEDSDDDDDESGNELRIERDARRLAREQRADEEDAAANLEEQMRDQTEVIALPSPEELQQEDEAPPDLDALKLRIQDVLQVLGDFTALRHPAHSRGDYLAVLAHDLSRSYGYLPELVELFLDLFPPHECIKFMQANESPRPVVIRTNTLKTRTQDLVKALQARGVSLEMLGEWSKVGIKVFDSPISIGATTEYLAGHYMLQSAASFLPCMALAPRPGERVIDVAAAPGGKTSFLAQLMRNTGTIIANDLKKPRLDALTANLQRLGVRNAVVVNMDGRQLPRVERHADRVLLDAPCTGLGVVSRDPTVKLTRTVKEVQRMSHLQKELLLAAIDCVDAASRTGGVIVYSTCSVSVDENEEVVNYALEKRHVKIVDTELPLGKPGLTAFRGKRFHPSLALCRRVYPHVYNMDGFFICKLKKLSNDVRGGGGDEQEDDEAEEEDGDDVGDTAGSDGEAPAEATEKPNKAGKKLQQTKKEEGAPQQQLAAPAAAAGAKAEKGKKGKAKAAEPAAAEAPAPTPAAPVPAPAGVSKYKARAAAAKLALGGAAAAAVEAVVATAAEGGKKEKAARKQEKHAAAAAAAAAVAAAAAPSKPAPAPAPTAAEAVSREDAAGAGSKSKASKPKKESKKESKKEPAAAPAATEAAAAKPEKKAKAGAKSDAGARKRGRSD